VPSDSKVTIVTVEPHRVVARRFSGLWSYDKFLQQAELLQEAAEEAIHNGDLKGKLVGEPYFARYNAPFTPFFLRRNEVLIALESN